MNPQSKKILIGASFETITPLVFHDAGYEVTLVSGPNLAIHHSHSVRQLIIAPADPAAILAAMLQHLAEQKEEYRWAVIADDPLFWASVDHGAESMEEWFPVGISNWVAELLGSKVHFLSAAEAAGIPVPEQVVCRDFSEVQEAAGELGYPVVLKGARGYGGSGVRVIKSESELAAAFATVTAPAPGSVMVQRFVDGEMGSTIVVYKGGKPLCWVSYFMRCCWPDRYSAASAAEVVVDEHLSFMAGACGRLSKFNGIAGIDWMKYHGEYLMIEFNPRPMGWAILGRYMGVDFPQAIRDWLGGAPVVQRPGPPAITGLIPSFPAYLNYAIHQRTFHLVWESLRHARWHDPLYVASQLRRLLTSYLPDSWKDALRGKRR